MWNKRSLKATINLWKGFLKEKTFKSPVEIEKPFKVSSHKKASKRSFDHKRPLEGPRRAIQFSMALEKSPKGCRVIQGN